MTIFKKQIFAVTAIASILASQLATVAVYATDTTSTSGTTLVISGNGEASTNSTNLTTTNTQTVVQNNNAQINNNVTSSAKSGGNQANSDTGGNVSIDTGAASVDTTIVNKVNSNAATLNCCTGGNTQVLISGNGENTTNTADLTKVNDTSVYQANDAYVNNNVNDKADSGYNKANGDTGGNVSISTGDASVTDHLSTTANVNRAQVGTPGQTGGSIDARILGNGEASTNSLDLTLVNDKTLVQDNNAEVNNNVRAKANTGKNDATSDTGGDVMISTGNADATVRIDNKVNFNAAELDCGCLVGDIFADVARNGEASTNSLDATLVGNDQVFQGGQDGNNALLNNNANVKPDSGKNNANGDTGSVFMADGVSIDTGDASSSVDVHNGGNVNVLGNVLPAGFPAVGFDFNVSLSLSQLQALLGM